MHKILVATNNEHKVKEIRDIFNEFEIISLKDANINIDIEENGSTFEENALIKARAIYDIVKMPILSDDSGLSVYALGGKPGVFSARYAGLHGDSNANNTKLLKELQGIDNRQAEFVCAVAFICDKGEFVSVGKVQGEILREPCGKEGFGYDPLFYSFELKKSFGDASHEEKNSISHRARALIGLKDILRKNKIFD